jgi:hypothetical protein
MHHCGLDGLSHKAISRFFNEGRWTEDAVLTRVQIRTLPRGVG